MASSLYWYFAAFLAPALFVGFALASLPGHDRSWGGWILQGCVNAASGLGALLFALWLSRQEGTLTGYAALCVACALAQWLGARLWGTRRVVAEEE